MLGTVDYCPRRFFHRLFAVCALLIVVFVLTPRAPAEIIRSFDSDVRLQKDTTLDVTETIVMDFESAERHGIYRHIPVQYARYGNPYSVYLNVDKVTDENENPLHYTMARQGAELSIRIGDANETVSGLHTYKLHYFVRRAVNFFHDSPEVYWNATGDQWPFAMEKVTARFFPPEGTVPGQMRTACFVGPPGSTQAGEIRMMPSGAIEFTAPGLQPGEGLTFVVGLLPGAVTQPTVFQWFFWWLADWWPAIVLPLIALLGIGGLWMSIGRDVGSGGAIAVEWNPPKDLSPAEVGTLIDESCDMADIVSTLVDLAARGHLTINALKTEKLLFMSRRDYSFTRTDPPPANDVLAPHEALFLKGVFQITGQHKVYLSALKGTFYSYLPRIRSSIYDALVAKKFFSVRPDRVRAVYGSAGVALIGLGAVLTFIGYAAGHVAWGLGTIGAGVVVLAFAKAMPAKTWLGTQTARECQGFRRFLSLVEKDRIAAIAKDDPTIFGRLLPYAMVLGVADQWAHAFEGLMAQPPDWYNSDSSDFDTFNTIWFINDLGRGMHSMSQTFVSHPDRDWNSIFGSSSWSGGGGGGFSGFSGGSSGGGFGGGGGGSW